MRICVISHSPRIGGAESVLLETISVLQERGASVLALVPGEGELSAELARRGVCCEIVPYGLWMTGCGTPLVPRLKTAIRVALTTLPTAYRIKKWKCDIVYSNTAAVCVGAFAAWLLRLPHVWHIHEFGYEDHRLTFIFGKKLSFKLMQLLTTAWIANSNVVALAYERYLDRSKSKTIYYSMHLSRNKSGSSRESQVAVPARNGALRCIIVGTLSEGKGQEEALRAIVALRKRQVAVELLVVGGRGDDAYRKLLGNIVSENHLEDCVFFAGHVADPRPFFESADVALVCSRAEAFGRVTVEAMLAGKPIIASRAGANTELIRDQYNGLLYTAADFAELADKIALLCGDQAMVERLGQNGKEWADKMFTQERYGNELFSFLQETEKRYHTPGVVPVI